MPLQKKLLMSSLFAATVLPAMAQAQPQPASPAAMTVAPVQAGGTLLVVPASGEVRIANDQAIVTLTVEEQDKDKAAAASRVNAKMKQGTEIVRRADGAARLQTRGYYTYPVYPDEQPAQPMPSGRQPAKPRQPIAWRVGQSLEVTTTNIAALPKTVAAAQGLMGLNGIQFGLTPASVKRADEERIAAAYGNLNDRIGAIARAMGRNPGDAVVETIDFEASGNYAQPVSAKAMMRGAAMADSAQVEEPSFEPGESILSTQVVSRVRLK